MSYCSVVALFGALVPASGPKGPSGPSGPSAFDHQALDRILREDVTDEGLVDYLRIKQQHEFDLRVYLDLLQNADLQALPRDEQLAAYINLYNASVIAAVLDNNRPADKDFAMFKEPRAHLRGQAISLNDLQNDVIRKQFKEPRVHAALVGGALSYPALLPRAYRGEDLDKTLEADMHRFVNDPSRNTIDRANRKLVLSRIFDWYADDFGGKDKVAAFVSKYADGGSVDGFEISFRDWDWTLNEGR